MTESVKEKYLGDIVNSGSVRKRSEAPLERGEVNDMA